MIEIIFILLTSVICDSNLIPNNLSVCGGESFSRIVGGSEAKVNIIIKEISFAKRILAPLVAMVGEVCRCRATLLLWFYTKIKLDFDGGPLLQRASCRDDNDRGWRP